MTAVIQKWGNSLAVRLPKAVADQIEIVEGSEVEMRVDGASLIIKAAPRKYRLADLLKGVTSANRHGEINWGEPKGKEVW